jgi:anti-sigma regulatory factor (Ser/Thr protein kinase)
LPSAVPCTRLHSKQVLWEWGLASLSDSAEVVVSELVTNAVQATTGRVIPTPIRLWLSSDHRRVRIAVWDADPRAPQPKPVPADGMPDWNDDGGRGLFLVAGLSQRWGWYATLQWGGKVVWAQVAA